jgi:hypothetical protein
MTRGARSYYRSRSVPSGLRQADATGGSGFAPKRRASGTFPSRLSPLLHPPFTGRSRRHGFRNRWRPRWLPPRSWLPKSHSLPYRLISALHQLHQGEPSRHFEQYGISAYGISALNRISAWLYCPSIWEEGQYSQAPIPPASLLRWQCIGSLPRRAESREGDIVLRLPVQGFPFPVKDKNFGETVYWTDNRSIFNVFE